MLLIFAPYLGDKGQLNQKNYIIWSLNSASTNVRTNLKEAVNG